MAALRKHQEQGTFEAYSTEFLLKPQLKKYMEKCCKYAWKLVCQTPPYVIEGNYSMQSRNAIVFNEARHKPCNDFANSARTPKYVDWIIWPGLFEGSSGRVIRKTEVILHEV